MLSRRLLVGFCIAFIAQLALPRSAGATTVQLTLQEFTGDDALVIITLDDAGGIITGNVNVQANPNIGDLQAIFLKVSDESVLAGLTVDGPDISEVQIAAGGVETVNNANVNGDGSPEPFDIGIAFGSPGIGSDDYQSTTFFLDHSSQDLTLALFDLEGWAARLTSVGIAGGAREGSSKLKVMEIHLTGLTPPPQPPGSPPITPSGEPGMSPIPEPGTIALGAVAAIFAGRWMRRRNAADRR